MYRLITTDGTELGITDSVLFIKVSAEGTYVEAEEPEAVGIAFNGEAYNLPGHSEVKNAKTVVLVKTSLAQVMQERSAVERKLQAEVDYLAMMADVTLDEPETNKTDNKEAE